MRLVFTIAMNLKPWVYNLLLIKIQEVCNYSVKPPHRNMWELKPEYGRYEKMAIEEDLETIYENAVAKNQLSGKDFTRWSHWCRFCLFLSDKNRVGTYNFDNESFILRLPLWFLKDYSELNKLPLSYDPYEKPVGSPPPTNYAIKVTGNEEGIKLQEGTNIIITKKSAHLCAQYRKLKDIIQPNTSLTDPVFINEKNKALARIQNTLIHY